MESPTLLQVADVKVEIDVAEECDRNEEESDNGLLQHPDEDVSTTLKPHTDPVHTSSKDFCTKIISNLDVKQEPDWDYSESIDSDFKQVPGINSHLQANHAVEVKPNGDCTDLEQEQEFSDKSEADVLAVSDSNTNSKSSPLMYMRESLHRRDSCINISGDEEETGFEPFVKFEPDVDTNEKEIECDIVLMPSVYRNDHTDSFRTVPVLNPFVCATYGTVYSTSGCTKYSQGVAMFCGSACSRVHRASDIYTKGAEVPDTSESDEDRYSDDNMLPKNSQGQNQDGLASPTIIQLKNKLNQNFQLNSTGGHVHKGVKSKLEKNKRYKCTVCSAAFSCSGNLTQHLRKHTGDKPFACKLCDSAFAQSSNLKQHMRTHTREKLYHCSKCKSSFGALIKLKEHLRLHSGERPFKCGDCPATFVTPTGLKSHMQVHVGDRPFGCPHCSASFVKQGSLKEHLRVHAGQKVFKCKQCTAAFVYAIALQQHVKVHVDETDISSQHTYISCSNSNTSDTKDSVSLKKEKTKCEDPRPYKCQHCNATFSQASSWKRHLQIHEGNKPFACQHCNASFAHSSPLKKHMRIHVFERPFTCTECHKSFMHPNGLKQHLRSHSGLRPFVCKECNAAFKQAGSLNEHMRIHLGVRPFVCDVCQMSFTNSGGLVKHVRIHTGERPFVCDLCSAGFAQSGGLKKHLRIHAGDRPYVCEQCQASFTQSGGLAKHMRTHLGETPFACEECSAKFTASRHLIRHKRLQHVD